MAFEGFIKEGSYTSIDDVFFNKSKRMLHFRLKVYKDNSKEDIIQEADYHAAIDPYYSCITQGLVTPPVDPKPFDTYLINGVGKKDWKGHSLAVARWNTEAWEIFKATDENVFIEDEGKYYKILSDGIEEVFDVFGVREFDSLFSIDNLVKNGNNIYKCIYEYLKTKDEFVSIKDV